LVLFSFVFLLSRRHRRWRPRDADEGRRRDAGGRVRRRCRTEDAAAEDQSAGAHQFSGRGSGAVATI